MFCCSPEQIGFLEIYVELEPCKELGSSGGVSFYFYIVYFSCHFLQNSGMDPISSGVVPALAVCLPSTVCHVEQTRALGFLLLLLARFSGMLMMMREAWVSHGHKFMHSFLTSFSNLLFSDSFYNVFLFLPNLFL